VSRTLLAIPNVSEGRDAGAIAAIGRAFSSTGARLLDVHSDADHHRSVFTLAGEPGGLGPALAAGARAALERIDLRHPRGQHPFVGVVDVAPIVYLDRERRGAACAEALLTADLLGELGLPVYLYGELAGGRSRAELRRRGLEALHAIAPDFGPGDIDPSCGATLVAARPPLVAFNLFIAGTRNDAGRIAALIREGGREGLPGVRALGMEVEGRAQVSTNVEDHETTPLVRLLDAVQAHADVDEAELVGLAPESAFRDWPPSVPIRNHRTIEDALKRV
jgi:glutamate formiminotransferase/glutamate formiminotransferase/formiminotetrahydrofolate cyclodeaminase